MLKPMTRAQLKAEVLSLPEQERAEIALDLLRSLSDESGAVSTTGSEWERSWADEAVARDDELEHGGVEGIPAVSAFDDARDALAERKRGR
jgi:hypothetical protein